MPARSEGHTCHWPRRRHAPARRASRASISISLRVSEQKLCCRIRPTIWRADSTDARWCNCANRSSASGSKGRRNVRNRRIMPQFSVKSWQGLPAATLLHPRAPIATSLWRIFRLGSGASLSISNGLDRLIFTHVWVHLAGLLWTLKPRPLPTHDFGGVFLGRPAVFKDGLDVARGEQPCVYSSQLALSPA